MRIWQVSDVTRGDLETALYWINEHFNNNVTFSQFLEVEEGFLWKATLRVLRPGGPGSLFTHPLVHGTPKPTKTACWHAQYYFYLELPDAAKVLVGKHWHSRASGSFPTWEMGSLFTRYDVQELCECEQKRADIYVPFRRKVR